MIPVRQLHWPGLIGTALAIVLAHGGGLLLLRYFDAFDLSVLGRILPIPERLSESWLFR
jgi:hypothetical protein